MAPTYPTLDFGRPEQLLAAAAVPALPTPASLPTIHCAGYLGVTCDQAASLWRTDTGRCYCTDCARVVRTLTHEITGLAISFRSLAGGCNGHAWGAAFTPAPALNLPSAGLYTPHTHQEPV